MTTTSVETNVTTENTPKVEKTPKPPVMKTVYLVVGDADGKPTIQETQVTAKEAKHLSPSPSAAVCALIRTVNEEIDSVRKEYNEKLEALKARKATLTTLRKSVSAE